MATTLPDEQLALLAAIVADPEEDTPRLVYADWLQEHGDEEQAQFIREAIAVSRLSSGSIEKAPGKEGAVRWLEAVGIGSVEPNFVRGFAEELRFDLHYDFFASVEDGLFRVLPVRAVLIGAEKDFGLVWKDVRKLAEMPELSRLHTLRIEGSARAWAYADPDPEAWPRLFASGHLRGLRRLDLVSCLTDEDAVALADSPLLAGLTTLDLSANGIGPSGALAIVRSPYLQNVTRLSLVGNDFDVNSENPDPDSELHMAVAERFGNIRPLYESLDD